MTFYQMALPLRHARPDNGTSYYNIFEHILTGDLDFHNENARYASHNFHSFPAKFPPQLPRVFIEALTRKNDIVLDPMAGSGTTVLESFLTERQGIGFDIDPLSILLSNVKMRLLNIGAVVETGNAVLENAKNRLSRHREELLRILVRRWDEKTKSFIDYWFAQETQLELMALLLEIENIPKPDVKAFFQVVFSTIIITKSGGVSLAFDLAHTRPHRTKTVYSPDGKLIYGEPEENAKRKSYITKKLRSAIDEFQKRFLQNVKSLLNISPKLLPSHVFFGNAQMLPIPAETVDLIVTSPPYASNAIDYMRAHKFTLVWLGYRIEALSCMRREYIGGEFLNHFSFETMPAFTQKIIEKISEKDSRKGRVLHRYYSEMSRVFHEMFRVLRKGKGAVVVVGSSVMRGIDTETHRCLSEIGESAGFVVPRIGVRRLDRNKRMMPVGAKQNHKSQIQQRMVEEFVIGLYKPEAD